MEKIKSEADYADAISTIDGLMRKGSVLVSKEELAHIHELALAAQQFEQKKYVIEAPSTLAGMIEMRMYEMKLKQKELAKKLNVSDAKLSLIMNGKQKPDIGFLKAVYKELKINADFILEHA